jgi:hypothetical protein
MFEESLTNKRPPNVADPARNTDRQKEGPKGVVVMKSCLCIVRSDYVVGDFENRSFGFSGCKKQIKQAVDQFGKN